MKLQILANRGEITLRGNGVEMQTGPRADNGSVPIRSELLEAIRTAVLTPDRAGERVEETFEINTDTSPPIERFDSETEVGVVSIEDEAVTINLRDPRTFS